MKERKPTPEECERAFKVMAKRVWFPRFIGSENGRQRWVAYSWNGCSDIRQTSPVVLCFGIEERTQFITEHPATCILRANDLWEKVVDPTCEKVSDAT